MPSILFSPSKMKSLVCPAGAAKQDFHDKGCKGLMLEARASGKRTWYLRYRDGRGAQRQFRIADAPICRWSRRVNGPMNCVGRSSWAMTPQ